MKRAAAVSYTCVYTLPSADGGVNGTTDRETARGEVRRDRKFCLYSRLYSDLRNEHIWAIFGHFQKNRRLS